MLAIGIGCILFRYSDDSLSDSEDFSIVAFKRSIIDSLELLEQISNLDYYGADDVNVGFRSFEPDEDGNVFPIACGFRISFDLHIPVKAQIGYGHELYTEHFHIDIIYGYDRPVMYCSFEFEGPLQKADPAMSVSIVRKFLADRISGDLVCDSIGPSPFHAQIYLEKSAEGIFQIIDKSLRLSGYADIQISVPDLDIGIDLLILHLNETLSRYYYLETQKNILSESRRDIINESRDLLNSESPSFFERLRLHFTSADKIDSIHRAIVSERLTRIHMQSYISEAEGADELGKNTPFGRFFDEFRQAAQNGDWGDFSTVANFFEDRRQRLFGNVSVLIGGIVGGVIGALIGATATFLLSSASIKTTSTGSKHEIAQPQIKQGRLKLASPAAAPDTSP